jgi:hypothetical protein
MIIHKKIYYQLEEIIYIQWLTAKAITFLSVLWLNKYQPPYG